MGRRLATAREMLTLARRKRTIRMPLLKPWEKPPVVSMPMLWEAAKVPPRVSEALERPVMTLKREETDCLKLEKHSRTEAISA